MNIQFCCHLCCSSSVISWSNPSQYTTVSFYQRRFSFADVVLPWFVYTGITLEAVAFDTTNNGAVFITDAPAKRTSKSDKSPIFRSFHTDCHSAQSLIHDTSTTECKQTEEHSMLPTVANTNSISKFLNVSIILSTPSTFHFLLSIVTKKSLSSYRDTNLRFLCPPSAVVLCDFSFRGFFFLGGSCWLICSSLLCKEFGVIWSRMFKRTTDSTVSLEEQSAFCFCSSFVQ
jgi:hypothetical protein